MKAEATKALAPGHFVNDGMATLHLFIFFAGVPLGWPSFFLFLVMATDLQRK